MFKINGKYGNALITIDTVEDNALRQIYNMVNHPSFTESIVIMPDVHMGIGTCVGFTMPLSDKIIPNLVGVDGSCGVLCVNIGDKLSMELDRLDTLIRRNIPLGTSIHDEPIINFKDSYKWKESNEMMKKFILKYNEKFNTKYEPIEINYDFYLNLIKKIDIGDVGIRSVGSLGSGNHFLALEQSISTNDIWVCIHSGSRNLGKRICEYHQNIAKHTLENKKNIELKSRIENIINTTDDKSRIPSLIEKNKKELGLLFSDVNINNMEYLEGQNTINYFYDMIFTYFYSDLNRWTMMNIILDILKVKEIKETIHSVHNYIDFNDLIIRKGAVSSYIGQKHVIPLNMRDGTLICEGKSNPKFNFSSPHGAGRVMSRGEANRKVDLDKFKETMKGIYSTSVNKNTLDESPFVYKKLETIEKSINETVTIIDSLVPIYNLKSSENDRIEKNRKKEKEKLMTIGDNYEIVEKKKFRKDRIKLREIRGKF